MTAFIFGTVVDVEGARSTVLLVEEGNAEDALAKLNERLKSSSYGNKARGATDLFMVVGEEKPIKTHAVATI